MKIEILEATKEDFKVVQNLVRFYIYDMSEHVGWNCPKSGLYGGCDDLPHDWGRLPEDGKVRWKKGEKGYPFVIRVDGKLAGFALIKKLSEKPLYDVGEFFVLRKYRGKGVGRYVAHTIFNRFKGDWQVRQMMKNRPAQDFWRKIIEEYTGGEFLDSVEMIEDIGQEIVVQRFQSRNAPKFG